MAKKPILFIEIGGETASDDSMGFPITNAVPMDDASAVTWFVRNRDRTLWKTFADKRKAQAFAQRKAKELQLPLKLFGTPLS